MTNIEKSGFRKAEYVGYGGNRVWRISKSNSSSGNWFAVNQNKTNDYLYAMTLKAMSEKLAALPLENMPKQNPSPKRYRTGFLVIEKSPTLHVDARYPTEAQARARAARNNRDGGNSHVAEAKEFYADLKRNPTPRARINRKSQITNRAPSARLKARRAKATRKGYWPNPIPSKAIDAARAKLFKLSAELKTAPPEVRATVVNDIARVSAHLSEMNSAADRAAFSRMKRVKAIKQNPSRASGGGFVIAARKGNGSVLHYNSVSHRFTNTAPPTVYATKGAARTAGMKLLATHFKSLAGYTLAVQEHYKRNPAPRSEGLQQAADRLQRFSGHDADTVLSVTEPDMETGLVVGKLDGVLYSTRRDGKPERYIHRFTKNSRPLLAASSDGKQLRIVGGQFEFTEAGIEDRQR